MIRRSWSQRVADFVKGRPALRVVCAAAEGGIVRMTFSVFPTMATMGHGCSWEGCRCWIVKGETMYLLQVYTETGFTLHPLCTYPHPEAVTL